MRTANVVLFTTTAALMVSSTALAFDPYAYVRGQFAARNESSQGIKTRGTEASATFGYMVHPFVGVQATFAQEQGEFIDATSTGLTPTEYKMKSLTPAVRVQVPFDNGLTPFATVGYGFGEADVSTTINGTYYTASATGSATVVSLGVDYQFSENVTAGLEAKKVEDIDGYLYGASLGYKLPTQSGN